MIRRLIEDHPEVMLDVFKPVFGSEKENLKNRLFLVENLTVEKLEAYLEALYNLKTGDSAVWQWLQKNFKYLKRTLKKRAKKAEKDAKIIEKEGKRNEKSEKKEAKKQRGKDISATSGRPDGH